MAKKTAGQQAAEDAINKSLADALANLKAKYDSRVSQIETNRKNTVDRLQSEYDAQSGKITGTRDANVAAFLSALTAENTKADQQKLEDLAAMEQSVQNDALQRGFARSTVPITTADNNRAKISTAYTNAATERQNAYNSNVANANNGAAAALAELANALATGKTSAETSAANELTNLFNTYNSDASTTQNQANSALAELMLQIEAQNAAKSGGGGGGGGGTLPTPSPYDYTKDPAYVNMMASLGLNPDGTVRSNKVVTPKSSFGIPEMSVSPNPSINPNYKPAYTPPAYRGQANPYTGAQFPKTAASIGARAGIPKVVKPRTSTVKKPGAGSW